MNFNRSPVRPAAFTLIEILIIVIILAIAAAIVIPNIGQASDSQAISAASILQADLEATRSLALTTQVSYSLVFSTDRRSYKVVRDYNGCDYTAAVAVAHPVEAGKLFVRTLSALNGMDQVVVDIINFGGAAYVTFGSMGDPNVAGSITLHAGSTQMVIAVEGLTGIITATRTAG